MPTTTPHGLVRPARPGTADAGTATPQQTEDERDIEIAEERLREIEEDPESVLRGAELDDFMKSILSS